MSLVNDGRLIASILDQTTCKKHTAPRGTPCWHVHPGSVHSFGFLAAVCNARVKRAGFNGLVDPSSLRLNKKAPSSKKEAKS